MILRLADFGGTVLFITNDQAMCPDGKMRVASVLLETAADVAATRETSPEAWASILQQTYQEDSGPSLENAARVRRMLRRWLAGE